MKELSVCYETCLDLTKPLLKSLKFFKFFFSVIEAKMSLQLTLVGLFFRFSLLWIFNPCFMNIYEHEKLTRLNLYLANYVFGSTKYGALTQSTFVSTGIPDF